MRVDVENSISPAPLSSSAFGRLKTNTKHNRGSISSMKISFSHNQKADAQSHQARAEQSFSMGDGHGDFCLTAYGATRQEAHANLRELAQKMVRELERVKGS